MPDSKLTTLKLTINVPHTLEVSFARQQETQYGPALMLISADNQCLWLPVDCGNTLIAAGATTKQTDKGLVFDGVKGKRFTAQKVQQAGEKHARTYLYPEGGAASNAAPMVATSAITAPQQTFSERPAALQTPPEPMPWDGDAKEPETALDRYLTTFERIRDYVLAHNKAHGRELPLVGENAVAMAATAFIQQERSR